MLFERMKGNACTINKFYTISYKSQIIHSILMKAWQNKNPGVFFSTENISCPDLKDTEESWMVSLICSPQV